MNDEWMDGWLTWAWARSVEVNFDMIVQRKDQRVKGVRGKEAQFQEFQRFKLNKHTHTHTNTHNNNKVVQVRRIGSCLQSSYSLLLDQVERSVA